MSTITPTTELDAVNYMLQIIGEPPVNTIDAPTRLDVIRAVTALGMASRATQLRGWYWNSEVEVLLSRSAAPDYEFALATNVLTAKVSAIDRDSTTYNYIYRAGKLYDRKNRTYSFPDTPTIRVDQIVLVDFVELPEAARQHIFRRAAIDFQYGSVASDSAYQITERMARESWASLLNDECEVEQFQLTSSPGQFELNYKR